ncbi:hypothetical protein AB0E73_24895, partial [Streptomyces sp. NPDC031705]
MTESAPAPAPPLAGGRDGADALRPLLATVLTALRTGADERRGPLPAGGPAAVTARVHTALGDGGVLPARGTGDHEGPRGHRRLHAVRPDGPVREDPRQAGRGR